jgi:hypothetical protein
MDEPLHLWQDFIPLGHGSEAWVRHSMTPNMGCPVTSPTTPGIDLSIGSIEIWNSSEHCTSCGPEEDEYGCDRLLQEPSIIGSCRLRALLSAQFGG